jgi:hypothetical protein
MTNIVWSHVFPSPRLYSTTRLLSLIALVCSGISIWISGAQKEIFSWLLFYIPVLWALWLCTAFFVREQKIGRKLFVLWGIINAAIWAFSISFSVPDNWVHSRDQDIVVATIFFPVVMPIILLLSLLPAAVGNAIADCGIGLSKLLGGSSYAEIFAIWIGISLLATIEAVCLIRLSKFFEASKRSPTLQTDKNERRQDSL